MQGRVVALLVVAALSTGCGKGKAHADASPTPGPLVKTITVQTGSVQPTAVIAGVIVPFRQVGVGSSLSEPISDVYVREGETVHAGQVLARLQTDDLQAELASSERVVAEDTQRYAQTAYQVQATTAQDTTQVRSARAALRQAQVALAGAETDLNRYQRLADQGYLASQTLDEQRTTVANDRAAVFSAQATLSSAEANAQANGNGSGAGAQQSNLAASRSAADAAEASTEQLRRTIARAVITSPLTGTVDAVNANPGEYPSGRQLFTIEQVDQVYAVLPASSPQVVRIRRGSAATVAPNGSSVKTRGTVDAVLDQVQPGTTNFTVKVLLPNPNGQLHGGMPVTGTIDMPIARGIVIPITAYIDDSRTTIYTVDSNGTIATGHVKQIADDGTNAVVTGISAGTRIIADTQQASVGNGDTIDTSSPKPEPSGDAAPADHKKKKGDAQ
jgi:multidrug resistance efflux pump